MSKTKVEKVTCVKESFSIEVEKYAKDNEISLIQATATLGEHYGIIDKINSYISRPLKEKIEIEAVEKKLIKSDISIGNSVFDL